MDYIQPNLLSQALTKTPNLPLAVQELFISDSRYARDILSNPHLSPELFKKVFSGPYPISYRAVLARTRANFDEVIFALDHEKRTTVLDALLYNNPPTTPPHAHAILAHLKNRASLPCAYKHPFKDPAVADVIGPHLPGFFHLNYLTESLDPDLTQLPVALAKFYAQGLSTSTQTDALTVLFDLHPRAIPAALSPSIKDSISVSLLIAAASSINLTSHHARLLLNLSTTPSGSTPRTPRDTHYEVLYQLVANIVTPQKILQEIAELDGLPNRISRALTRRANLKLPHVNPGFRDPSPEAFSLAAQMMRARSLFAPQSKTRPNTQKAYHLSWIVSLAEVSYRGSLTPFIRGRYFPQTPIDGYRLYELLGHQRFVKTLDLLRPNLTDLNDLIDPAGSLTRKSLPTPPKPISKKKLREITTPALVAASLATPSARAAVSANQAVVVGSILTDAFAENLARWQFFAELATTAPKNESSLEDLIRLTRTVIS